MPTKCWHANRFRLSSNDDAERTNRAIAKITGRVEEEAIAHRIEVSSMPRCISYRAILPRTSSKRSSSSFRGILAFIPRAFLVELPRRLFISTLRGRDRTRRNVGEEDEEGRFPSVSSNATSWTPALSLSLVSAGDLERRCSFLDT